MQFRCTAGCFYCRKSKLSQQRSIIRSETFTLPPKVLLFPAARIHLRVILIFSFVSCFGKTDELDHFRIRVRKTVRVAASYKSCWCRRCIGFVFSSLFIRHLPVDIRRKQCKARVGCRPGRYPVAGSCNYREQGASVFRRRRRGSDFAEEIRAHLELEADELRSGGLSEG
jgi:hypothetical protein